MPEQLSPEQISKQNVNLINDAKVTSVQYEDAVNTYARYDDDDGELESDVNDAEQEAYIADQQARFFQEEHKDALHEEALTEDIVRTEAITKEGAHLYDKENVAIEEHLQYEEDASSANDYGVDVLRNMARSQTEVHDAIKVSDTFAQEHIDVLHEAALKVAEDIEKKE